MKDPAFLFYSKDWLEGTADLPPNEKGVFIDLLAHQHQKKGLPTDTVKLARLARLSHDEFMALWQDLSAKFFEHNGKFFNKKLCSVIDERKEKGKRNAIVGTFSQVLRKAKLTPDQYNFVRSAFKIEHFEHFESECLSERLSEWLCLCLKSIGNANADVNKDSLNKEEEAEFEKKIPADFKVEVVPPKETKPVAQISMISLLSVDACLGEYFRNNIYAKTREQLAMSRYMDESMLLAWAEAFNRELVSRGDLSKPLPDWMKHFKNWLAFQDMNKNPMTLHHEQKSIKNEQGTSKQGLNASYKDKLARKIAGNPGNGFNDTVGGC